jgi:hypothetical protein
MEDGAHKQPSAAALAIVREAARETRLPEEFGGVAVTDFDVPSLVLLGTLHRHYSRDGVVRLAPRPIQPDWPLLAKQADDVVLDDLTSVQALAALLDAIGDAVAVRALIILRQGLAAVAREIQRREVAGARLSDLYRALTEIPSESLPREVARKFFLPPRAMRIGIGWTEENLETATAEAMLYAVEALRAGPLAISYARLDAGSPFRKFLGRVAGWDDVAWQFLAEDIETEHRELPDAVRLANVPQDAGRIIDATLHREGRRPALILRRAADITDVTVGKSRTPAEELEYRARVARQAALDARFDTIVARYPPAVRRAAAMWFREGATDEEAARVGKVRLRTWQRRKQEITKKLR